MQLLGFQRSDLDDQVGRRGLRYVFNSAVTMLSLGGKLNVFL
jgi:hypothetical protein